MPFVPPVQTVPSEQTLDGFILSASGTAIQDTPAGEAIKLIEAGKWVEAIQAIESLKDVDEGLVLDERGVLRPLSAMKITLIASMPDEGRRTFRKLNDPAANAMLADALKSDRLPEQASAFKAIVDDYALCDAAAEAALRIGEIRFEQGRFNESAAYFGFASRHPAGKSDDPALIARRLTALSRAGQWGPFDELAEYARFRHADTSVKIAGQDVPLQSFITDLLASRGDQPIDPIETTDALPAQLALPNPNEIEYERMLFDKDRLDLIKQTAISHRVRPIIDRSLAPVVLADNDQLYALALGRVTRLDPETGTELWGMGSTDEAVQGLQSRMRYLVNGYQQSLTLHGDTLLTTLPQKRNIWQSDLFALDAETGKEKWNLTETLRRKSEGVVGQPLVVDELIYFTAYRSSMDLTLYAVRLDDGSPVSELALGKAAKDAHLSAPAELSPRLTMGQSHLLVQTNNGALIAVEPNSMTIAWAYAQKIRPSGIAMMRRHGFAVDKAMCLHTGDVAAIDGMVIAKDTRTNRVVALREYDAAMLWQAEADPDATIVHHDDQRVYVLGEELVALDLRTGERLWWTPHQGQHAGQPVFTQDACLIAGNQRLCRIDLTTGKLTDYREDLAQAAALHVVGQRLLSVTNTGITASLPAAAQGLVEVQADEPFVRTAPEAQPLPTQPGTAEPDTPADQPDSETPAPAATAKPDVLKFHLMDGTIITGKLTTNALPITTEFGDLVVPMASITSVSPGLGSHPEIDKTIKQLIDQLANPQAKIRDNAQAKLLAYGPALLPELSEYAEDPDAERKVRIATITEELLSIEPDEFEEVEQGLAVSLTRLDHIVTPQFTIAGKITQDQFTITSKFGELSVKLADIKGVERVSKEKPEVRKSISVAGTDMTCRQYKKTGIRVNRGDRIIISAEGRITMSPWGSNSVSGPDGIAQNGMYNGKIPMGALAGRIGDSGEEFLVGSKASFVAKKSGTLQLGFAMQQNWANYQFPGEYKTRIRLVPAE
eukprot:g14844.t1